MYERVEIIDERGVEHVFVYASEQDANTGAAPIHKYERWPDGVPNWQGFMNRLDLQSENNPNGTGLFEQILSINPLLGWKAYDLCLLFTKLPKDRVTQFEFRTLQYIYSNLYTQLNETQRQALNQAIQDFNIPIKINQSNG